MKNWKSVVLLTVTGFLTFSAPALPSHAAWVTTSAGTQYTQTKSPGYLTGFQTINGKTYFFNSKGIMQTGWIKSGGKRYYLNKSGVLLKSGWILSRKYYADKTGAVLTGAKIIGSNRYYFSSTGRKQTNTLKKIGSSTYYFGSSGAAVKNEWVKLKSSYYHFNSSGKMDTSTWIGDYYVNASGVRVTGWQTIDDKKYYFSSSGKKITSTWLRSGANRYFLSSKGVAVTGLCKISGKKYYFYPDSRLAVSTKLVIGTSEYTIGTSGEITESESIKLNGSGKGIDIVNYALKFVGNPYVYGGTSLTKGADCSGFVQSVFAHFNIKLLRVANDQMQGPGSSYLKQGYAKAVSVTVSTSTLLPGDLLFYGSGNYANHVAIYIGNGQIVHASNSQPYPAGGIKISNYNYRTPLKAIRYWS